MNAMRPPAAFSGGGVPSITLPSCQAATGSISRRGAAVRLGHVLRSVSGIGVAEPRDAGIEHDQIVERDADAAEPHGKPRRLAFRQHQRAAGLAQAAP